MVTRGLGGNVRRALLSSGVRRVAPFAIWLLAQDAGDSHTPASFFWPEIQAGAARERLRRNFFRRKCRIAKGRKILAEFHTIGP